ncbi:unnamed protein product [Camellia sinensis]
MPVKRSLIGRSSSFGDSGVLSPPIESADGWLERRSAPPSAAATAKPPSNSSKAMKPSVAEKSLVSPPRILTLSSPVQEESIDGSDDQPIGEFLDKCYYCKKKIGENAEVFMYSSTCVHFALLNAVIGRLPWTMGWRTHLSNLKGCKLVPHDEDVKDQLGF